MLFSLEVVSHVIHHPFLPIILLFKMRRRKKLKKKQLKKNQPKKIPFHQ
jgi:hypothetical protein